MTTRLIIILLLLSSCFSMKAQAARSCSLFRTGKFLYRNEHNELITVIRKKTKQKQISNNHSSTDTRRIVWTDDCSFKIYLPGYSKKSTAFSIITITPLTDSTFISTCNCAHHYSDSLIIYSKQRFILYNTK